MDYLGELAADGSGRPGFVVALPTEVTRIRILAVGEHGAFAVSVPLHGADGTKVGVLTLPDQFEFGGRAICYVRYDAALVTQEDARVALERLLRGD